MLNISFVRTSTSSVIAAEFLYGGRKINSLLATYWRGKKSFKINTTASYGTAEWLPEIEAEMLV